MNTPKKTLQFVLDDADPAHERILALIATVREFSPSLADKTDSDIVNEALRVPSSGVAGRQGTNVSAEATRTLTSATPAQPSG